MTDRLVDHSLAAIELDVLWHREMPLLVKKASSKFKKSSPQRPINQSCISPAELVRSPTRTDRGLIDASGQYYLDFCVLREDSRSFKIHAACANAADMFDFALMLDRRGCLEEAIAAYRRTIALDPSRTDAYFNLANALSSMGRLEAAEEIYRLVVSLAPGYASAFYNFADVLYTLRRFEEAAQNLRRALQLSPALADAHYNLALCLERLGDFEDAQAHWRAYIRLDPSSEWADKARGHLIAKESTASTKRRKRLASEKQAGSFVPYLRLAT